MWRLVVATSLTALLGCGRGSPGGYCFIGECVAQESRAYYDEPPAAAIDLVVVIDDSPSMAGKQVMVLERLQRAMEEVVTRSRLGFDLEMRVISTTPEGGGAGCGARRAAACSPPPPGVFRWNRNCGEGPNFDGPPDAALACAAGFPAQGCALEQPLAALEAELQSARRLRPRAYLLVVIVTDEDDCSFAEMPFTVDPAAAAADGPELSERCREADEQGRLPSVSRYLEALRQAKPPWRALLSVVAGPCMSAGLDARPAPRLRRFAAAWESAGTYTALCEADWRPVLRQLEERLVTHLIPCLPGPLLDRDPAEPGVQPECTVTERPNPSGPATVLPSCRVAGPPCWRLVTRPGCSPSGHSFVVDRGGCVHASGSQIAVACATDPRSP